MRKKWLACAGVLGLAVLLNPDFTHGQPPGGFGGKGKGGFGGDGGGGRKGGFGGDGGGFGKGGFKGGFGQAPGGNGPGMTPGLGGGPPGGPGMVQGAPQGGFGGPPGGGMGGPGGRGGFGGTDAERAERSFAFFSQGADVIDMNKMDENQKRFIGGRLQSMGLTPPPNGIITKQQYIDSATRSMAARSAGGGAPGMGGPPGMGGQPGMGGPGGRGGPPNDADMEDRFRRYDLNGDGRVSREEAAQSGSRFLSLQNFDQLDTNRDGFIDLNEYKAYRVSMSNQSGRPGDPNMMTPGYGPGSYPPGGYPQPGDYNRDPRDPRGRDKEKEKEPELVAVRYGKLPQGLPDWWADVDTDKDGNIGLYEWRQDGRPLAEFRAMDLDGDGLISPAEYFAYVRVKEEDDRKAAAAEGIDRPRTASRGAWGGGNNRGPGGNDQGGSGYRGAWGGGNNNRGPGGADRTDARSSDRPDARSGDRPEGGRKGDRTDRPEGSGKKKGKGPRPDQENRERN
jgi:hypothetical protein